MRHTGSKSVMPGRASGWRIALAAGTVFTGMIGVAVWPGQSGVLAQTAVQQQASPQQTTTQPVPPVQPVPPAKGASPAQAAIESAPAAAPREAVQATVDVSTAVNAPARQATETPDQSPLTRDECILQVLNRFTYGPRPGDLEKARAEGLSKWLTDQFNPSRIDYSAVEQMIATNYPAMELPLDRLVAMYPNAQMVRATANGRVGIPSGEGERAIYNAQQDRAQNKKNGTKPGDAAAPQAALPVDPAAVVAMVPEERFKALLKLTPAQLRQVRQALPEAERPLLTEGFTPHQLEVLAALANPQAMVASEVIQTKLLRDIYSERQLEEVMVDFWLNHFNVYMRKSQDAPYLIASYERDVIRRHALGHFESLLVAVAESPAMLNYLDNAESVGPRSSSTSMLSAEGFRRTPGPKQASGLNENYARELMELHTLGVNGGYTQQDVTEVAKVFTGWTTGPALGNPGTVAIKAWFDPTKHEPGAKTVLGVRIKENDTREGMQVLHLLATSPQTAHFISTKLAVRFVSDQPPAAMVDSMAKTFAETNGDIRLVLLTMIRSPEFFARANYRAKVKTPQDYVISAVRASGARVTTAGALESSIAELGMPVFGMQTPQGYSMRTDAWNNTAALVTRMNFALALSSNRVAGLDVDWPATLGPVPSAPTHDLLASAPASAEDSAARLELARLPAEKKDELLELHILHLPVSERTRRTILTQIKADPGQQRAMLSQVAGKYVRDPLSSLRISTQAPRQGADPQIALGAGLLFGSPEFQRR